MYVIPKKNLTVRDVDNGRRILPPEGAEVKWSMHWQRRINDGSVTVGKPQAAAPAQPTQAAAPAAKPTPAPAADTKVSS